MSISPLNLFFWGSMPLNFCRKLGTQGDVRSPLGLIDSKSTQSWSGKNARCINHQHFGGACCMWQWVSYIIFASSCSLYTFMDNDFAKVFKCKSGWSLQWQVRWIILHMTWLGESSVHTFQYRLTQLYFFLISDNSQ